MGIFSGIGKLFRKGASKAEGLFKKGARAVGSLARKGFYDAVETIPTATSQLGKMGGTALGEALAVGLENPELAPEFGAIGGRIGSQLGTEVGRQIRTDIKRPVSRPRLGADPRTYTPQTNFKPVVMKRVKPTVRNELERAKASKEQSMKFM